MDYVIEKELLALPWINEASKMIGIHEVKNADVVKKMVADLGLDWFTKMFNPSTVPWCGAFVAHCIKTTNNKLPTNWMRAKEWATFGEKLNAPIPGCIVVFEREGGGHVGFVVGTTKDGLLIVLGGNQDNQVKLSKFKTERVFTYTYPSAEKLAINLPVFNIDGGLSTNEA